MSLEDEIALMRAIAEDAFVITNDEQHADALRCAEDLMKANPKPGTALGEVLDVLAKHIEAYEVRRWPFDKPTPEEAAAFRKEQEVTEPEAGSVEGHARCGDADVQNVQGMDRTEFEPRLGNADAQAGIESGPASGSHQSERDHYLGDGVYVAYDGYMIRLSTYRDNGEDYIYLEPSVWSALQAYVKRLAEQPARREGGS